MSNIQSRRWLISRRHFLRGAGACLALPFLETMGISAQTTAQTRRFVGIANPFGMIHDAFFPAEVCRII